MAESERGSGGGICDRAAHGVWSNAGAGAVVLDLTDISRGTGAAGADYVDDGGEHYAVYVSDVLETLKNAALFCESSIKLLQNRNSAH